jgi:hypothetical protein
LILITGATGDGGVQAAAVAGKANKSRIIDKISDVERYSARPNWETFRPRFSIATIAVETKKREGVLCFVNWHSHL